MNSLPEKPWNEAYRREAEAIAGSTVADWGQRWAALEFFRGRRKQSLDVAIAMRALMLARGELDLREMIDVYERLIPTRR